MKVISRELCVVLSSIISRDITFTLVLCYTPEAPRVTPGRLYCQLPSDRRGGRPLYGTATDCLPCLQDVGQREGSGESSSFHILSFELILRFVSIDIVIGGLKFILLLVWVILLLVSVIALLVSVSARKSYVHWV